MRALPEIEQRRGLGEIVEGDGCTAMSNSFGLRNKSVLNRLTLHRTDDIQTHRRGDCAAQVHEDEQAHGRGAWDVE